MDYADQYGRMHAKGKYFPGYSISPYVDAIAELVKEHGTETILDYGCGRGLQYLRRRVHEKWGGILPECYDPGVNGLHEMPETGPYDAIISTDVAEHIDEKDLPGVLQEMTDIVAANGFVFLSISCRPTKKTLPDGRDVHLTIRPPSWWKKLLSRYANPVRIVAHFDVAGHFDEPEEPWDSDA